MKLLNKKEKLKKEKTELKIHKKKRKQSISVKCSGRHKSRGEGERLVVRNIKEWSKAFLMIYHIMNAGKSYIISASSVKELKGRGNNKYIKIRIYSNVTQSVSYGDLRY